MQQAAHSVSYELDAQVEMVLKFSLKQMVMNFSLKQVVLNWGKGKATSAVHTVGYSGGGYSGGQSRLTRCERSQLGKLAFVRGTVFPPGSVFLKLGSDMETGQADSRRITSVQLATLHLALRV
jgi:hypothetical protein